jgi:iron uptake system component EfeO
VLLVAALVVTVGVVTLWVALGVDSGTSSTHGAGGPIVDPAAAAWSAHAAVAGPNGTEVHVVSGSPTCIDNWHGGPSGSYVFDVLNDEGDDMEIYLQDTTTKKIYLEVENFGINATRQVAGVIPPGTYEWVCITAYTIKSSKPITVTGKAPAQPVAGIVPVSPLDMRIPINTYTAWVQSQLPALSRQVRQLDADLHAGGVAAAKQDWLTAHLTYETLGAAYGAFGDLNDAINGDPASDVPAVTDPHLTGFRKIEALLWSGTPTAQIAPYGDKLITDVGQMAAELAKPNSIAPLDMGIRAHEILEDTLGKDLNGIGDAGSHTELATVDANITGTFEVLRPLEPLLTTQDPWLSQTETELHQTQALVESYHHADGWVPLTSLTTAQRAAVNAHVQEAVELLSHIPPITEPRDNPDEEGGSVNDSSSTGGTGGNGK